MSFGFALAAQRRDSKMSEEIVLMSIEDEIKHLKTFLSHPAGFIVDIGGDLCIFPIYEMREYWEVTWKMIEDDTAVDMHRQFVTLDEAVQFFVEKRRYLCLGSDFNAIYAKQEKEEQNV